LKNLAFFPVPVFAVLFDRVFAKQTLKVLCKFVEWEEVPEQEKEAGGEIERQTDTCADG
jgi:hypothetical protein